MGNDSEVTVSSQVDDDPEGAPPTGPRHRASSRKGWRGVRRFLPSPKLAASLVLLVVSLAGAAFAIALAVVEIPEPNDFATREASIFTWADESRITHVGVNRQPVEFDRIPKVVRDAVLAAEDRSFYSDPGVSVTGLLRAVKNNITSGGGSLQGGSTITQQYVKNYYLTQEQTFSRKAEEILVSIKIANEVPKDIVLRDYLNTAFFARGTYGVEAASRAYFGVPVGDLADDPARAAYIAAIIQSPYYYATAPDDPEAAKVLRGRWDYVVDGMVAEGWLDAGKRGGMVFPEPVKYQPDELTGVNGYAVDAATQFLNGLHERDPNVPDAAMLTRGGYTVVTTYRPDRMAAVEEAVSAGLANLDPGRREDADVHLAVACVDVATGAVVGFHGGPGYLEQSFNDAFQANGPIGELGRPLVKNLKRDSGRTLESMRIFDARDDGEPPGPDDLATTPMRAASAFASLFNTEYHEPHHVAEVRKDGELVWRAPEPDPEQARSAEARTRAKAGAGATGGDVVLPWTLEQAVDDGGQWAWAVGDDGATTTAVAMFATNPDGKGNRRLDDMSPMRGPQEKAPSESGQGISRANVVAKMLLSGE
ncbi:transglycosylase domain-containing protein [Umezawaea sp. Da 62-37]|uniref:transglycosylase domain-containing protein n=1 Tax=Umezawaea sp. Da 62-37 TaxID=3075927 RepID=UPI0028F742E4|nr:transglycosylase domain-containing protein [Umezawaea sp. Da 62-37]WNV88084.1 transglycosylase domain-containing protein [Umezawaea sp. Da 62-37]